MPLTSTRTRRRRALQDRKRRHELERRRERDRRARGALVRRPPWDELPDWPGGPDDGGAGVREPRRPRPQMPAGAMELELPTNDVSV